MGVNLRAAGGAAMTRAEIYQRFRQQVMQKCHMIPYFSTICRGSLSVQIISRKPLFLSSEQYPNTKG